MHIFSNVIAIFTCEMVVIPTFFESWNFFIINKRPLTNMAFASFADSKMLTILDKKIKEKILTSAYSSAILYNSSANHFQMLGPQ